jgi:hypothetical protein
MPSQVVRAETHAHSTVRLLDNITHPCVTH